jgi:hypothetical protein
MKHNKTISLLNAIVKHKNINKEKTRKFNSLYNCMDRVIKNMERKKSKVAEENF